MGQQIEYGKQTITRVSGDKLIEIDRNIVEGSFVAPQKVKTEESIEVRDRKEQDAQYIKFADEEERLQKAGKLLDAEFQVRRTPAATRRGVRYAISKFTILDNNSEYAL